LPIPATLSVDVGAMVKQKGDYGLVALKDRRLESVAIRATLSVDVGAMVKQKADHGLVALTGCRLESAAIRATLSVDVGTVVEAEGGPWSRGPHMDI
jgi:hypothetical protein